MQGRIKMEQLISLYERLKDNGVMVFEQPLMFNNPETKSVTMLLKHTENWGIFIDTSRIDTLAEEKVILAHECGHYETGTTHEVCSPLDLIEKHEYKANKWEIKHLISEEELDEAIANGYTEIWSLAEYFDVTEDFMKKVVCWYTYGNLDTELYF